MNRRRRAASALLAAVVLPISGPAFAAPTDYFWNAPTGGNGTWDIASQSWSTSAAGPLNYTWANNGNERANFSGGTSPIAVTIDNGGITAYGLNITTSGYVFSGGILTLSGTGGVISSASVGGTINTTINSVLAGNVGLTKLGGGTLTLAPAAGPNTFTGAISIGSFSTLLGTAQASGSPFGAATNSVSLSSAALRLNGIASSSTTTTVGAFSVSGFDTAGTGTGVSSLIVDNTLGGGNSTTFTAGNLSRGGTGAVLAIVPVAGTLGTGEVISFANGNALVTNTILPAWVAMQTSGTNAAVDFTTHGGTGVIAASYSANNLGNSSATDVINQSAAITLAAPAAAYALKTNAAVNLNGNTLTLGSGSGTAGMILNNGGAVTGGNISFGNAEAIVYLQGTATVGSAGRSLSSVGLTMVASGASTVTIASNIVDGNNPSHVSFTGITSGTSLTLSGANTYTGGTTLEINTGSAANVVLGSDTAFGTNKVTNILPLGASSPQIQATAARTLANAFDLNGGLTFTGTNNIAFTGPITIINAGAASRTLQNSMTANGTVSFGSAGSPSTMTLGNPASNGGDGVGKNAIFSVGATAAMVINDVMRDPPGGSGGGSVTYSGTAGGFVTINSQSTYTGPTNLNGATTIQFSSDSNAGGTAGPFGAGTLNPNNSTNNILTPIGGGTRIVANPISMTTGFTVANATGDTTNLVFTGPIAMTATGRTIANNMTGGTLTLGSAATPSTLTMATATGQTLTINNGGTLVVNDAIQDFSGSISTAITISGAGTSNFNGVISTKGAITVSGAGTVSFNALNTHSGGVSFTGAGTIVPVTLSSNALPGAGFTAGPFGTGAITVNNGTNQHFRPSGGDRVISNAITMTTGLAMDNATGESFSLTFAGPITMTNNRFISNGFTAGTTGGALILGSAGSPSTLTLPATTSFTLSLAALAGPIIVNDVMQNASGQNDIVAINPNANNINPVTLNAANTYTGGTTIGNGANGGGTVILGSNSAGPVGSLTSGPFGTGTVTMNQTATAPVLMPSIADRSVSNAITMTSGFTVANLPSTSFNLNLNGPISLTTAGRAITNNMTGGTLTLGSAATPSTLTLGSTGGQQLQFQASSDNNKTIVNDVIKDATGGGSGAILISSGTVTFTAANTYSGATAVSGGKLVVSNTTGSATGTSTVSVFGTGAAGSGGTIGGIGSITGPLSISSTTAAQQGGVVSPGNSAGTLNVASLALNPLGRYVFEHSVSNNTAGGGVNDLIAGTGQLDLSTLSPTAGGQFDLSLAPLSGGTPQATYTLATFNGGIIGSGGPIANGTPVTGLFIISGSESVSVSAVTVVAAGTGQSLQLTLNVPEPGSIGLCAIGCGLLAIRRRRRS